MTVDKSREDAWRAMQDARARDRGEPPLKHGGGGGTSDSMEGRVARLEAYVETVRADIGGIKAGQDRIIDKLNLLPTRTELNAWKWQWLAVSVAIFAVVVATIIGGLAWLDPH